MLGRGLAVQIIGLVDRADQRFGDGVQALDLNLVDELGNRGDAIAKAAALGGISGEPRIVEYEHIPSFQDLLLGFSAQATQNEADVLLQTLTNLSSPVLEYRYAGPGAN